MVVNNMCIKEFFKGKSVFVTGGSGFLGKVLIEKLLRSCEGIEVIYVLLREKKGMSIEQRLNIITENVLFKPLKETNPEYLKKLIPIYGDVKESQLGMSEKDRQTIIEKVNIIYHGAASVRFDDFLKDSVLLNTRGTRDLVNLALEVKNLVAFIHISTAYCNCDQKVIEEKLYPPHADWRTTIEIAEKLDQQTLDVMAPKYMDPLPNTYTFAKSLSEHVVTDLCKGKVPAVIFRPSVVISTYQDPVSGWIDNFNGPVGLLSAGGIGLLKVSYGRLESGQDYIPVDIIVKMLIIATKERAINKDLNDVTVYNGCAGDDIECTNRDLIQLGGQLTWDAPCQTLFWYPSFTMTNNWYKYYMVYLIYHMLPALIIDGLLKISGRKPILTKIQRKIYIANTALIFFMRGSWSFICQKSLDLTYSRLMECDKEDFSFSHTFPFTKQDLYTFYIRSKIGVMRILFKEEFNIDKAFRNTMIMWILDRLLHFTIYAAACWYLVVKLNIFTILCKKMNDLLLYWNDL